MHRLSVSEFSSYRWSFFQDIIKYANLGFDTVGLWRAKVADYGFENAAELIDEMQISVSSLSWAGGFTGSEGITHRDAIEDAIEAVYQAHMVGADKLIVHAGARNGHTEKHALRLLRQALNEITPIASNLEITLLLEPVLSSKSPWSFVNSVETYADILAEYPDSELGLALDLFHIGRKQEMLDQIPALIDRIKLVQLSDGRFNGSEFTRCELGTGIIPVESWLDTLMHQGFEGDFEIELHGFDFEHADYAAVLNRSNNFFTEAAMAQVSKSAQTSKSTR